ncbi:hypothetical protein Peur_048120 [Populus x canadensis]
MKISSPLSKISNQSPSAATSFTKSGFGVYVRNPNLQQWFEYCLSEKKCSCPVCKQNCSAQDGGRLYSQSVGDQTEPLGDRNPGGGIERQVKEIKQLNEEELDALKLESIRLHDRNVALTKELVALKLVSDVNLEEDEVLKPASFGIEANNKDTVDIIRKSVTRVQELEIVVEVKDNETLRALKAPKKTKCKGMSQRCFINRYKGTADPPVDLTGSSTNDQENFNFISDKGANSSKEYTRMAAFNKQGNAYYAIDEAL